jgi:hypothetical protein
LSRNTTVGANEVETVSCVQQTFEPGAKSTDELTSTSYFVAPGTGSQENCGSNISSADIRSVTCGVVVEGQDHVNEETGDGAPRLPSESTGTTFQ